MRVVNGVPANFKERAAPSGTVPAALRARAQWPSHANCRPYRFYQAWSSINSVVSLTLLPSVVINPAHCYIEP